jgi:acid stress-induced BolA-like protein IbaG/YrbA
MESDTIKHMIEAGLPGSEVQVTGDGTHFEAVIISDAFAGRNSLARHRMVYTVLGDAMQSAIHALSMRTYTKAEWLTASKQ